MDILAIDIERIQQDSYCGTLTYAQNDQNTGTLLWTVENTQDTRIVVSFVQGDQEDWLDIAREYAHRFSDNIILVVSRRKNVLSLAPSAPLP